MRSVAEIQEELNLVRSAMRNIAAGAQSYQIGTRSVTKANLAELRQWRIDLEFELDNAQGGGSTLIGWPGR